MQRGENPNQLLSGVVFTQNQTPAGSGDKFSLESTDYVCQEFRLPSNFARGSGAELNIPELTGIQLLVTVTEDHAVTAGLDWVVQHYVSGVGWTDEASGTSVQSHAEGDQIWYDLLFDEGIQPTADSLTEMWRFGIAGRVGDGITEVEVPYDTDTNIVIVDEVEYHVKLYPDRPHPFVLNGVPSILLLKREDNKVYYNKQHGISDVWASVPNPLQVQQLKATTRDSIPLTIGGEEASLCFRLLASVGDEGVDFLGNNYREAVRRNYTTNVTSVYGEDSDTYWMSKPNPSRFAVESLYFDVRDLNGGSKVIDQVLMDPITPGVYFQVYYTDEEVIDSVERFNYIRNPHFASSMDAWTGVGIDTVERVTNDFYISAGSAHLDNVASGDNYIYHRVLSSTLPGTLDELDALKGKFVTLSAWVKRGAGWALDGGDNSTIALDDGVNVVKAGTMDTLAGGAWERQSVSMTIDSAATKVEARLYNGGTGEVWWDGVLLEVGTLGSWFQGTKTQPPPTPTSIHEWEERIWKHVPKSFRMVKRDSHVFPEPIEAKYMKVEFSHLQPRSYNPGDFPQPIIYKKHPRWVLDYFVARRELDDYEAIGGSNFSPRRVGVRYDALDLAYNYYLDDIAQEPDQPVLLESDTRQEFASAFNDVGTVDIADSNTLSQVKVVFDQFKQHPAINSTSLQAISVNAENYPTEYADLATQSYDTSALRDLNKQAVIYEQSHPVMFFFMPCRHRYKELTASLTYNRAYFAGVRQVAFSRERYTVANDSNLYVETMGDNVQMERMDFIRESEGKYIADDGGPF